MARTIQICNTSRMIAIWLGVILFSVFLSACEHGSRDGRSPENHKTINQISSSPLGHYLAARLAQAELDSARAANFYEFALSANPENQVLLHNTMISMLAEGRIANTIELAERSVAKRSDAALARLILAVKAMRKDDLTTAQEHLSKTNKMENMSLFKPLLLAWIHGANGQYKDALEALDHLRKHKALEQFTTYHTALISEFSGRDGAARRFFEISLKRNSRHATRVALNYGRFLSSRGRRDEAIALFGGLLTPNPRNSVIGAALEKLNAGDTLLPPITTAADGVAETFLLAGYAFLGSHGTETGRIYTQLALYLRPDFDAAKMLLAEILEAQNRFPEAISVYRKVRKESIFFWSARLSVAANLNNLKRSDESVTLLRGMAKENPNDITALMILARVLRAKERFKETITVYNEILKRIHARDKKLKNHHWVLLYERGVAYERSKQWRAAEKDFLNALELRPDQPRVLNYLGYSWIEQGVNLEKARKMIETAVSKRPRDGFIIDSLGWVFYQLGHYAKAVKHLERAVEIRPQDPIINDHLGDAYWRAGRKLEARFQWNRAIELGAGKKMSSEIRAKQTNGLGPAKSLSRQHDKKRKSGG